MTYAKLWKFYSTFLLLSQKPTFVTIIMVLNTVCHGFTHIENKVRLVWCGNNDARYIFSIDHRGRERESEKVSQ